MCSSDLAPRTGKSSGSGDPWSWYHRAGPDGSRWVAKTYIRPGIESLSVDSQGIDVAYTGTGSVPVGLITAVPDDLGPDQTVHSSFNAGEWEIEMRLSPGWDVSGVDLRALMDSGPGSRISIHSAQNRGPRNCRHCHCLRRR